MNASENMIFIHGLEGSSQGVKATLLRELFPGILTPDFKGSLEERMTLLYPILADKRGWIIIGSSFGGLMGALFTCQHPERVEKLVLLAPALIWPDFAANLPDPVNVPTLVIHGSKDELIPLDKVQNLAQRVFTNLDFRIVTDDHGLYKTVHELDWHALIGN